MRKNFKFAKCIEDFLKTRTTLSNRSNAYDEQKWFDWTAKLWKCSQLCMCAKCLCMYLPPKN